MAVQEPEFVGVIDIASGRQVCRIGAEAAKFSPDSRWLLTSDPTRLVDIASCTVRLDLGKDDATVFSPHSRYLYVPSKAAILDLATLKPVRHIAEAGSDLFSKSGRYFATGGTILDLTTGRVRKTETADTDHVVFTPDERHVAIKTPANGWILEDLKTGRVRHLSTRTWAGARTTQPVIFSDSGRYVAIEGGNRLCILNTRTQRVMHRIAVAEPDAWYPEAFLGDRVVSVTDRIYSHVYFLPTGHEILHGDYNFLGRSGKYLIFTGVFEQPHPPKVSQGVPDTAIVAADGSARYLVLGANSDSLAFVKTPWPDRGRYLIPGYPNVMLDVVHARALGWSSGAPATVGPTGKRVLSILYDDLEIWNTETGAFEATLLGTPVAPARVWGSVAFDGPTSLRLLGDDATLYSLSAAPRIGASARAARGCFDDVSVDLVRGIAAGYDATLNAFAVCRLGNGRVLARHPAPPGVRETLLGHDGNHVLVSGNPASLWDWRNNTWKRLALRLDSDAALGSGDLAAVFDRKTLHIVNVRSGKVERSIPHLAQGDTSPIYLDARGTYLVTSDHAGMHGFDLSTGSRVDLGDADEVAMNSRGVVALAQSGDVEFRDRRNGKLLGSVRILRTTRSVTALWQDTAGGLEVIGDRAPWVGRLQCQIGDVGVPAGLCLDVLGQSGVARRILERKPPEPAPGRAGNSDLDGGVQGALPDASTTAAVDSGHPDAAVQGALRDASTTATVDSGRPDAAVQRTLFDASTTAAVDSGHPDAHNAANTAQDGSVAGASGLIRPGVGALGLRVDHSTLRDALKRLGHPTRTIHHGTYSVETVFKRRGMSLYYCARDRRKRIYLIEFRNGSKAETPTRIHVGSTVQKVFDTYGHANWWGGSPYCWLEYPGVQFFAKSTNSECIGVDPQQLIVEIDVYAKRGSPDCAHPGRRLK